MVPGNAGKRVEKGFREEGGAGEGTFYLAAAGTPENRLCTYIFLLYDQIIKIAN